MLTIKELEELQNKEAVKDIIDRCRITVGKLDQDGSYVSANNVANLINLAETLINTFGIPEPVYPAYHVSEYTGSDVDDNKILTGQDILDSYFDHWIKLMAKVAEKNSSAREILIRRLGDVCITDYVVVNWAVGINKQ